MNSQKVRKRDRTDLRWGFSTGACLTALCSAAYLNHTSGWSESEISLHFPDSNEYSIPLLTVENGYARVQKDGGDDPDITNGAHLSVRIVEFSGEPDERDYLISSENGTAFLHGKFGVGLCTRHGLPCPKGKWAINPVPRQMVLENLKICGFGKKKESLRFEITVENGDLLAKKTLNKTLGIIDGISLLGTTGRVRPYSHKAYIDTIRMLVKGAVSQGECELIFATGTRTSRSAKATLNARDLQVILIGDYIQESLQSAESNGVDRVSIACMPGKLSKYASGFTNTHAHKNAQNLEHLQKVMTKLFPHHDLIPESCPSVREALFSFEESEQEIILKELKNVALKQLQNHAPSLHIEIFLCNFNGEVIL